MKRAVVVAGLIVGILAACRDQQSVTAVKPGLSADFSDGRSTGGNRHFFFLPPLVSQPTFSGVFNPQIQPVVDICQLDLTLNPVDCAPGVPHINPGTVMIDAPQQYHVNWDTKQPAIDTSKFYRIGVFGSAGGIRLGFADMDPVANGSGLKNVNTAQYIGLIDGRTLPIKFRIEQGAFLPDFNCTDCVEASVTSAGATIVTNTGFAGAQFPAGWITSSTPVVVTIERQTVTPDAPCIATLAAGQRQFEGCYQFKTFPRAVFATNVTVGVCANVPPPNHDVIQLFSVDTIDGELVTRALPNVPAPFVSCEGFASAAPPGSWRDFASHLLRRVEALLTPTPAYAFHLGAGGSTCCFSRIGWALPPGTLINPDVDPGGTAINPGTVINSTYTSLGVTLSRTNVEASQCGGSSIYANDNGPLEGGGFGFNSGDNVITICPEGTASDFSEASGGRIVASFSGSATQVCIQAYVTGSQPGSVPGARALLEAFNSDGGRIAADTSQPNAFGENLCVQASGISSVQFAGVQTGFAMFDNLMVTVPPPPPGPT
jgi:hypothetical protein